MKYAIFIDIDGILKTDHQEISNRCKNMVPNYMIMSMKRLFLIIQYALKPLLWYWMK